MAQADKTLTCRDCGTQFVFTQGEQEFYASKGLTNQPSRCPDCRAARKRSASGGYGESGGSYSSGGYGGGSSYGGPREMFDVTCDSCGKPAKVPFQPRGDRPVYCSDCFQQQRSTRSSGSYGGY